MSHQTRKVYDHWGTSMTHTQSIIKSGKQGCKINIDLLKNIFCWFVDVEKSILKYWFVDFLKSKSSKKYWFRKRSTNSTNQHLLKTPKKIQQNKNQQIIFADFCSPGGKYTINKGQVWLVRYDSSKTESIRSSDWNYTIWNYVSASIFVSNLFISYGIRD